MFFLVKTRKRAGWSERNPEQLESQVQVPNQLTFNYLYKSKIDTSGDIKRILSRSSKQVGLEAQQGCGRRTQQRL